MAEDLPEFDPQKSGIYEGHLRLSFIKAMDKIASDEISEFTELIFPLYLELRLPKTVRFGDLRRQAESNNAIVVWGNYAKSSRDYVDKMIGWAKKYEVDCEWYLDALHERLGFLASAYLYSRYQIETIEASQPFKTFLDDYHSIKNDPIAMRDRSKIIDDILRLLKVKDNVTREPKLALQKAYKLLKPKSPKEISRLEDRWRMERIRVVKADEINLQNAALEMSYNYGFAIRVNDYPLIFESHAWQFNEERKSAYRAKVLLKFTKTLDTYLSQIESFAEEEGHKRVVLPRTRFQITPRDRMEIFVMYHVKKWSPKTCLNRLQEILIEEKRDDPVNLSLKAVPTTAFELSNQLGFGLRKSKTKQKK